MVYDPYSAAIAAGTSALEAGVGYINTMNTNKANLAIAESTNEANKQIAAAANALQQDMFNSQMDYNRAVQEETWNRADTTFQRAVMDASKAGLSPLAVLENANNVGATLSAPSAPSMHVPTMVGAQMSPLNPAFFGSLEDGARAMLDIIKQDRRLSSEEKMTKYKEEQENIRFEKQLRQTSALTNKRLNLENTRASRDLQEKMREFNATLEMTVTENNRRYAEKQAEELRNYVSGLTNGASGAYRYFRGSFSEYRLELRKWGDWYSDAVSKITADYEADSYSNGVSANVSANSGNALNGGVKVAGNGFDAGYSDSLGASAGTKSDNSESHTRSFAMYLKQRLASEIADNPYPVWEDNPYYRANPYY